MIRSKIAELAMYIGLILSIIGWITNPIIMFIGYALLLISPTIQDSKYEYSIWKSKYLKNSTK